MDTKKWVVDNLLINDQLAEAADLLKNNEVIAFPTETVYGLGANALSDEAVSKIFIAKGRPSDNPLIIHIAELEQVYHLVQEIPDHAKNLMDAFWPGPLTLVFKKRTGISKIVTAGLDSVAIRMPDHLVALHLIKSAGVPVAAPSANLSGKPSPTLAEHVTRDLDGRIAGIVDGGPTGVGLESTVVDCTGEIPTILRPGGVTLSQLEKVVGLVKIDPALTNETETPRSPGLKYTHYAPDAPLIILQGSQSHIQHHIEQAQANGKKVGILTTKEQQDTYTADVVLSCGSRSDLTTVAKELYITLRKFNDYQLDVIFSESFATDGVGEAIMNRLIKAAGNKIIKLS